MTFDRPERRDRDVSSLPMINVVLLLLAFFVMAARFTPPEPLAVDLPEAEGGDATDATIVLILSASGEIAHGRARGEAALADAARSASASGLPVLVRADRASEATELARILGRLTALGAEEIRLATRAP